jgi:DNA topoisomerase-1
MLITRLAEMATLNGEENEGEEGSAQNGTKAPKAEKGRIKISSQEEANAILADLQGATYKVLKVDEREQRRQPNPPYTTSTMQQESSSRLYFKPKKTMSLAQQLYEGIELGERGHQGLITYMRTDSTRISEEAQARVKQYIGQEYGQPYVGQGRTGKAKATTQDAHEAIRPTDVTLTPQIVKPYLSADQFKLYNLIWRRFVASFMTPAVFDTVRVDIVAAQYVFRANGSNLKFPGFYAVWPREEDEKQLPKLSANEDLDLHGLKPEQHFTQPPPRYSEASLIKELEEQGIGRPSTYVPIISTIQDRGYVEQEQRRFIPTWLGETVNEVMNKHFPEIVDVSFTADMERKLDDVEEGRQSWREFLHGFYGDFKEAMKRAEAEMERVDKPLEEIDETCPECGRNLVIRTGRFGRFISCSGFPECSYRRSIVNKTGALCPQCGGDLVERRTRQKKRIFYGCSHYPECNFAIWEKPVPEPCPNCGGLMVVPRAGQEAVCYQEVVLPQRSAEEIPHQNGTTTTAQRTTRRRTATATTGATEAAPTRTKARTAGASRAKKSATNTEKTTATRTTARKRTTTTRASSRKTSSAKKSTRTTKASAKKTTSSTRGRTTGKTVR